MKRYTKFGDDLHALIRAFAANPAVTERQRTAWCGRGKKHALTHGMLGYDHDMALTLDDGTPVGSLKHGSARRFRDYADEHVFAPPEDLVRFCPFMHLDLTRMLALLLKAEWERHFAHDAQGWRASRGLNLTAVLFPADDGAMREGLTRFRPRADRLFTLVQTLVSRHAAPSSAGGASLLAIHTPASFGALVEEMVMGKYHLVATDGAELARFAARTEGRSSSGKGQPTGSGLFPGQGEMGRPPPGRGRDEGRITSGAGEHCDLRGCIVVVTTNAGTPRNRERRPAGFRSTDNPPDPFILLARRFPEEFLGRFDELVVLRTLTVDEIREILGRKLDEAVGRLQDRGVFLVCDRERLLAYLLGGDAAPFGGGRDMARLVERRLVAPPSPGSSSVVSRERGCASSWTMPSTATARSVPRRSCTHLRHADSRRSCKKSRRLIDRGNPPGPSRHDDIYETMGEGRPWKKEKGTAGQECRSIAVRSTSPTTAGGRSTGAASGYGLKPAVAACAALPSTSRRRSSTERGSIDGPVDCVVDCKTVSAGPADITGDARGSRRRADVSPRNSEPLFR